ncbi:MAG: bifunctional UDP-N-acetylglucosamine diphosphorylase/glucosamine-1-phosphate N-acetyltransferase GlmU [Deltaproteobacteria bacterium]|nr:bifunctional UDP-N-acetylglucosamine diphosphorylase/glucosamine-1-phosphate N-acetyltransferase GlmU [Deltaproteobacteria bacterium]
MKLASVVLCAGKGTRMKSDRAKVLHPALGRPLCAWPLSRTVALEASPVVAVVGHQAEAVERAVRGEFPGVDVRFALQAEQKGTGHAVQCAAGALEGHDGAVLILYGDAPLVREETLSELLRAFRESGAKLALVSAVAPTPFGYGRVLRRDGRVVCIREQKDCSAEEAALTEVNAGIYVADARWLWAQLATLSPKNAQGEYYLTDLVERAAAEGGAAVVTAPFEDIAGVNDRVELAAVSRVLQRRINAGHMRAGVTFEDPESAFVDGRAELAADVEVGPQVSIRGRCRVGRGARLGQGSVLTDTVVGEGVEVKPYSVFEEAVVGASCTIGPFARLRPGTVLDEGVHLGNFVETKKARIGRGSKANHLAYLGDAEIGSGVNVGAGTITCNYDGTHKHVTRMGDGVFIGSDTQLVAPVTVGAGAYVGAGTTVTADVPPGALAVSRTPQRNIERWAERKVRKG